MAGFFGKVKNTGLKAKLQGECALLDRELKARKQKFGVDLYDLLRQQEKSSNVLGVKTPKPTLGSFRSQIQEHWDKVHTDILALEQKQEAMRVEKTHEEVRRERGTPAITAKERVQKAGGYVASTGKETKLMAQIALMDRDIKKRKEQFGLDVYDAAVQVIGGKNAAGVNTGFKAGVKNAVRGGLVKVSESEQLRRNLCTRSGDH